MEANEGGSRLRSGALKISRLDGSWRVVEAGGSRAQQQLLMILSPSPARLSAPAQTRRARLSCSQHKIYKLTARR